MYFPRVVIVAVLLNLPGFGFASGLENTSLSAQQYQEMAQSQGLVPSKKDADEIERSLHIDSTTWSRYRLATEQLTKDGKNSPLRKAYEILSASDDDDSPPPTIDAYTKAFTNTAGFSRALPPDFAVREYARWVVALHYYVIVDGLAGKVVNMAHVSPGANSHDQNHNFVHTHRGEIDAFERKTFQSIGIEPPPEG